MKVEFSPISIEAVLHEEVPLFGKPDHQHLKQAEAQADAPVIVPSCRTYARPIRFNTALCRM